MKTKTCKFCGKPFSLKAKGGDQEYCQPNHRRYENTYRWLKRKKEAGMQQIQRPETLDEDTKKKIKDAVKMTIDIYGDTLKKLAKNDP